MPASLPPSSQPPEVMQAPEEASEPEGGGAGWTILAIVLALLAAGLFAAWQMGLIEKPNKPMQKSAVGVLVG